MPTYKHPCPHCDRLIQRDVAACPFCGVRDPFAPRRCAACRTPLDDPAWTSCPRCGAPAGPAAAPKAAAAQATPAAQAAPKSIAAQAAPSAPGRAPRSEPADARPTGAAFDRACAGCAAPLPEGARFCTVCGTLAG